MKHRDLRGLIGRIKLPGTTMKYSAALPWPVKGTPEFEANPNGPIQAWINPNNGTHECLGGLEWADGMPCMVTGQRGNNIVVRCLKDGSVIHPCIDVTVSSDLMPRLALAYRKDRLYGFTYQFFDARPEKWSTFEEIIARDDAPVRQIQKELGLKNTPYNPYETMEIVAVTNAMKIIDTETALSWTVDQADTVSRWCCSVLAHASDNIVRSKYLKQPDFSIGVIVPENQ